MEEILTRIAEALERQVAQHDEAVSQNRVLRGESLKRHEQEREAELAEMRVVNQRLMEQIDLALAVAVRNTERLEALESAPAVAAVGSGRGERHGPTTRDKESSSSSNCGHQDDQP